LKGGGKGRRPVHRPPFSTHEVVKVDRGEEYSETGKKKEKGGNNNPKSRPAKPTETRFDYDLRRETAIKLPVSAGREVRWMS